MSRRAVPFFLLCLIAFTGCSISTHEKDGKKNDVDIKTPFGSLSVKEGTTNVRDTGLSLYPGARERNDDGDNKHNANVNISSSMFGVKVVALKFESDDSSDKVLAFYRREMGKYGKVVDCTGGGFNMNFHRRDKDAEVTCGGRDGGDRDYREVLKVGTENNQRIMAIKQRNSGSEFALVYVRVWEGDNKN
jgi:hypothetical protein